MSKPLISAASGATAAEGHEFWKPNLDFLYGEPVEGGDPIFAAIRRHKAAVRSVEAAAHATDEDAAAREGRIITDADFRAELDANGAEAYLLTFVLLAPPVTIAGLRAALSYVAELEGGFHLGALVQTLLKSPLLAV